MRRKKKVKFNLDCLKKLHEFFCNFVYTTQAKPIIERDINFVYMTQAKLIIEKNINFLQIGMDVYKLRCVIWTGEKHVILSKTHVFLSLTHTGW